MEPGIAPSYMLLWLGRAWALLKEIWAALAFKGMETGCYIYGTEDGYDPCDPKLSTTHIYTIQ